MLSKLQPGRDDYDPFRYRERLCQGGDHPLSAGRALEAGRLWGPKSQGALDRMLHRKPSKPQRALGWIRNLQRDLTKLHFYSGPITGVETPATKTAVIRFQHAAHLKPDGLWGARSQAALDKMLHRH